MEYKYKSTFSDNFQLKAFNFINMPDSTLCIIIINSAFIFHFMLDFITFVSSIKM